MTCAKSFVMDVRASGLVFSCKEQKTSHKKKTNMTFRFSVSFCNIFRWAYLLYLIFIYYVANPKKVPLWDFVKPVVVIFQNAALLEVCTSDIFMRN